MISRSFSQRSWTALFVVAMLLAAPGMVHAQKKAARKNPVRQKAGKAGANAPTKADRNAQKSDEKAAEEVVKSALPQDLVENFPVGREFKGVTIPSYEGDVLKSVLTADSVTRVDEQFLDLLNMVVHVYNSSGEPETTISMDEAAFDLLASELRSKTPSTIEQPRFTMTGDTMIFQTDSQVTRLVGNVRLVIPDAGGIAPEFNPSPSAPKSP